MTEDYIPTLKGSDLDRYMKKLQCLCGRVGESSMLTLKTWDPYQFPSTNGLMMYFVAPCGLSKFVYVFLLTHQVGTYGRAQSIEAYNYYQRFVALNGVQWYIHFDLSAVVGSKLSFITVLALMTHIASLKAKVNSSQKLNDKPHEPWVAVGKRSGSIVTAHCTCMAG